MEEMSNVGIWIIIILVIQYFLSWKLMKYLFEDTDIMQHCQHIACIWKYKFCIYLYTAGFIDSIIWIIQANGNFLWNIHKIGSITWEIDAWPVYYHSNTNIQCVTVTLVLAITNSERWTRSDYIVPISLTRKEDHLDAIPQYQF